MNTHFTHRRLPILKVPHDPTVWLTVEQEIATELASSDIADGLTSCLENDNIPVETARAHVNRSMDLIVDIFYRVFKRHNLTGKRKCSSSPLTQKPGSNAAPKHLRQIRLQARQAQREYCTAVRSRASADVVISCKRKLNILSTRCRATSKAIRFQTCLEWRSM